MCGITGIVQITPGQKLNRAEATTRVGRMVNALRQRGPDAAGTHIDDSVALGSVRLAIVGGESGRQPMSADGNSLVYNGEIYNFHDLAEGSAQPQSDTQVLFNRLRQDGLSILPQLNGGFSFCFAESRAVYLVRDRYGEKPLYYAMHSGQMYFASEIKALATQVSLSLRLPNLYPELETAVGSDTVFEEVRQVEAGTYLRVDRATGNITTHRYYDFPKTHHTGTTKEQILELRRLMDSAISLRTPHGLTYGSYLSGGIDSSIVAMASSPTTLLTYVPASTRVPSEERFSDMVASSLPTAKYLKVGPGDDVMRDLVASVYANDGPTTTVAAYSQFLLAKEANREGIRVMLGGDGADEFLIGYARQLLAYLPESELSDDLRGQYAPLAAKGRSFGKSSHSDMYANLLNRASGFSGVLAARLATIFKEYPDPLQAISVAEATLSFPPLISTSDHLNMAFGIETRNPFLDHRVVDFALSMRPDAKIHKTRRDVTAKYALRQAYADLLPEAIMNRRDKVGFTSHIQDLLSNQWQPYVQSSRDILTSAYPDEHYYRSSASAQSYKYSRADYQILQLAITHLLYVENLNIDDVVARITSPVPVTLS